MTNEKVVNLFEQLKSLETLFDEVLNVKDRRVEYSSVEKIYAATNPIRNHIQEQISPLKIQTEYPNDVVQVLKDCDSHFNIAMLDIELIKKRWGGYKKGVTIYDMIFNVGEPIEDPESYFPSEAFMYLTKVEYSFERYMKCLEPIIRKYLTD